MLLWKPAVRSDLMIVMLQPVDIPLCRLTQTVSTFQSQYISNVNPSCITPLLVQPL